MQGITAGVPYAGARGALKEDLGVKDTYANGFNVQNITSFGVNPSWMGLQPAVLNQKIQALVWKEMVWGVPWGMFWHWNASSGTGELSATEITNLIQYFKASGATIQTNTGLVNWLLGGTQVTGTDGNYYYKFPATSMTLDFRPTKNSPVVDAGQNLGVTYALDINGVNQNSYGSGWDIGAHVYQGYAVYGGETGSYFKVGAGTPLCGSPAYSCVASTSPSTVVQLPATLPAWTASTGPHAGNPLYGAGLSATTNEFGTATTIFRLTDLTNNCNPNAGTIFSSGQVANSGSGDETHFNANSTLVILGGTGGYVCPEAVTIAGSSLAFSRIDNNFSFPSTTNSVTPSYNSSAPNLMYAMNNAVIQTYDFTGYGPSVTPPTPSTFYDFTASANCLGGSYGTPTWVDHISNAKYPPDSMFGEAFSNAGGQGTGFDVVAYKPGSGCVHLNTQTGVVTGDWGTTGTIGISDRWLVHNALLSKDGQWMLITYSVGGCLTTCAANSGDPYLWQIGTTTVLPGCMAAAGDRCGGHWTEGSEVYVNASGSSTFQQEKRAFLGAPNAPTDLKSGIASCTSGGWGIHSGWPNVDSSDSYPYLEISTSGELGTSGNPFTCPFLNEVDLVSPAGVGSPAPGAGTVSREAHTFNSGQQSTMFSCEYAIGAISTDGRIAIWESDGMGAFGSTSGGSSCSGTSCRCEVLGMLLQ